MTLQEPSDEEPLFLAPGQWDLNPKTGVINIKETNLKRLVKLEPLEDVYLVNPEPIARGQFAVVYHCTNRFNGKEYAAKFSSLSRLGENCMREIVHEIAVSAMLRHCTRTIHLADVFKTEKEMILLMEYAPGGDLQTLLDEDMVPYEKDVIKFMRQLLEGLIYIHERNIVHLDIKPQNVVLMGEFPDCAVKLCDFEISRMVSDDQEVREILGTPDYVAPEILLYEPITTKTDMWSVGVLTYVLLTGFLPFGGGNDQETFMEILKCEVDFPSELFEDITPDAIDFIQKLLIRKPEQRMSAKESLNHVWMKKGISRPNPPSTLDLEPSTVSKEPTVVPIIISKVSSTSEHTIMPSHSVNLSALTTSALEIPDSNNLSIKSKVMGRPPLHPFSSQKSLVGENNSCSGTPVNTPCENSPFSSVYRQESKLGSRHNLERMRSMSKSREVISGRVQMSNLKKCLSKSRERLCEARFGTSKSREQLMILNSFSQSVEALSHLTQQNLYQSCNNIFLPKFCLSPSTGNSSDRMYQSMAAIDQIDNMDYSKSKGFFESSISLINPSCSDISAHVNPVSHNSTNITLYERSPDNKNHFGLRGNPCRGGRTGSTDACDSRYTGQRHREPKITPKIPKTNERMKKDAEKRRKEKDRQERIKKEKKSKLSEKDKNNNTENYTKSKASDNSSSPPFRKGSVSHVEQRLQERHERNLERQEKLLKEEKQNKRKTSVDNDRIANRIISGKSRTKSTSSLPISKERTRSLTPTRRLSKRESVIDSDVSHASSLESVSLSEKSSIFDIAERTWNRHERKLKKSSSDGKTNKDYTFAYDENTETDEAYASLEEVPCSSYLSKDDQHEPIEELPNTTNDQNTIKTASTLSSDEEFHTDNLSVIERIYHFEKKLVGGLKRSRPKINNLVLNDHCNCELKELPVITEEASTPLHSPPSFRRSVSSTSDFGSLFSESSEASIEKDNYSTTSESSSGHLSPDWKRRSKSFSVYTNPLSENILSKSRSNSFNLDMLDNDLARPWGIVCSGAVARAFEKFNIKPTERLLHSSPNINSNNLKFNSNSISIKTS